MPSRRAKAPAVRHRIPVVVQTVSGQTVPRQLARRRLVVAGGAAPARGRGQHLTVPEVLHAQVLLHPALVADLNCVIDVAVHVRHRGDARAWQGIRVWTFGDLNNQRIDIPFATVTVMITMDIGAAGLDNGVGSLGSHPFVTAASGYRGEGLLQWIDRHRLHRTPLATVSIRTCDGVGCGGGRRNRDLALLTAGAPEIVLRTCGRERGRFVRTKVHIAINRNGDIITGRGETCRLVGRFTAAANRLHTHLIGGQRNQIGELVILAVDRGSHPFGSTRRLILHPPC